MTNATCLEDARSSNARSSNGTEGARDPERTRRLILQSASVLFAEQGPDAATVDQIARQAGYSKRMVYHYFGSKEGLYLAVLKSVYSRISEVAVEAAGESVGLLGVLDHLIQEYFAFLQKNPEFVALLNWENSHDARGLKQIDVIDFIQPIREAIREAIEREQRSQAQPSQAQQGQEPQDEPVSDTQVTHIAMTCVALCGYYFSNQKSMSAVFKIDLGDPAQQQRWLDHVRMLVAQGISTSSGKQVDFAAAGV